MLQGPLLPAAPKNGLRLSPKGRSLQMTRTDPSPREATLALLPWSNHSGRPALQDSEPHSLAVRNPRLLFKKWVNGLTGTRPLPSQSATCLMPPQVIGESGGGGGGS
uniref:Uncharacterized protein n=1 Tax=Oryza punctata TaxID=4537 RepID=A0A0E0L8K2_ORYPU